MLTHTNNPQKPLRRGGSPCPPVYSTGQGLALALRYLMRTNNARPYGGCAKTKKLPFRRASYVIYFAFAWFSAR